MLHHKFCLENNPFMNSDVSVILAPQSTLASKTHNAPQSEWTQRDIDTFKQNRAKHFNQACNTTLMRFQTSTLFKRDFWQRAEKLTLTRRAV